MPLFPMEDGPEEECPLEIGAAYDGAGPPMPPPLFASMPSGSRGFRTGTCMYLRHMRVSARFFTVCQTPSRGWHQQSSLPPLRCPLCPLPRPREGRNGGAGALLSPLPGLAPSQLCLRHIWSRSEVIAAAPRNEEHWGARAQ